MLTVVIDHKFDISKDFAVPAVGLFLCLDLAGSLTLEDAGRLRVEHKRHGEQPLYPF